MAPMLQPLESVLAQIPLFEGLAPEMRTLMAGCATNVRFEAGEQIMRRGGPADAFYLVRHGSAVLETYVPARGPVTIETVGAGEVLGWSWLFAPYRWHLDARALTLVRATAFDGACLRGKCQDDSALGYELMSRFAQVLIERLQWTQLRLIDVYGTDVRH
jgi:CRP/FNR family cyclic AMP-dependent transcriptional regulator